MDMDKTTLPDFFNKQFIPIACAFVLILVLTRGQYPPFQVGASMVILLFYSYFIHRLYHHLPIPAMLNIHMGLHHKADQNDTPLKRAVNLLLEAGSNIVWIFGLFYGVQRVLKVHYVPNIVILYYGVIYVTMHIVNYSMFHAAPEHVAHHTTTDELNTRNYGPDLVDHLFSTNSSPEFENYNHILPNIMGAFLLACFYSR